MVDMLQETPHLLLQFHIWMSLQVSILLSMRDLMQATISATEKVLVVIRQHLTRRQQAGLIEMKHGQLISKSRHQ